MPVTVEICVEGVASALAALEGGADRIELCENLAVGGVTPGAGAIAVACRHAEVPVHVLIRPRGGDFRPSAAEFEAMHEDIAMARTLGASGFVLGVLDANGVIDRERTARLAAWSRPGSVTFHRAFDEVGDPFEALDVLIDLGIDRVLTSGGAATAVAGRETLTALVRHAAGRIQILAGGRIAGGDIPSLVAADLKEIHIGSAACIDGRTDSDRVRDLMRRARA